MDTPNASLSQGVRPMLVPKNENGASSVEYGLIVFAIAALIALVVFAFGETILELFTDSCDEFSNARSGSNC